MSGLWYRESCVKEIRTWRKVGHCERVRKEGTAEGVCECGWQDWDLLNVERM